MILPRAWNKYEVALLIEAYTHITLMVGLQREPFQSFRKALGR